jgi:hypothetical protein
MMSLSLANAARTFAAICALSAGGALVGGCALEPEPGYPGEEGVYGYPPDDYLATTDPVYFDGRASYWYGGRWNYREGGRWNHYGHEPRGLYQRRMQGLPRRHMYEPGGGHAMGHGGAGRGGGGGHGGGHR